MKKNEIILLIVLLIAAGGGLAWNFLSPDGSEEGEAAAVTAGDLEMARDTFTKNLDLLKKGGAINKEFKQFAVSMEDTKSGGDPGIAATNQLYNVLHDKLGIQTPNISMSREEQIPTVEDYYFINVTIKAAGTEAEMKNLLSNMEQLGFLIKSFKMTQQNHGQSDSMDMEVVVSRLIKHDENSRKKMGVGKKGRSSLRPIS